MGRAYRTHGDSFSDPPRAVVCTDCGALVADTLVHNGWHDEQGTPLTATLQSTPDNHMRLVFNRAGGEYVEIASPDIRSWPEMVRLFEAGMK